MKTTLCAVTLAVLFGSARVEACTGDCSNDAFVTVDEIIQGVSIALGSAALTQCEAFDADGGRSVTVDEIVAAVTNALNGCSETPTATQTSTVVATNTPPPPASTATSTSTPPPPASTFTPTSTAHSESTPTATATGDVVDGVSREILGAFGGEARSESRVVGLFLRIDQTGTAQVSVTDFVWELFGSTPLTLTAETPTRIVYFSDDPLDPNLTMQSLTLELAGPGHLTGTYTEEVEGFGMFTYAVDVSRNN
jgi:hypothetical protein